MTSLTSDIYEYKVCMSGLINIRLQKSDFLKILIAIKETKSQFQTEKTGRHLLSSNP